jgi:hypothetical protein
MADFAVFWSVRVALAFYWAALALRLGAPGWSRGARLAWTLGYAFFLLHLAAAFHFVHRWSHDSAIEETARRTYEVVGFNWGGGVYVNYVFALVWGIDVVWWWGMPASYERRPRLVEWGVHAFLGFIVFNATAVFGQGPIRWIGWAVFGAFAVGVIRGRRRLLSTPVGP